MRKLLLVTLILLGLLVIGMRVTTVSAAAGIQSTRCLSLGSMDHVTVSRGHATIQHRESNGYHWSQAVPYAYVCGRSRSLSRLCRWEAHEVMAGRWAYEAFFDPAAFCAKYSRRYFG